MHKYFVLALLVLGLTNCMSAKRYNSIVQEKYMSQTSRQVNRTSSYLTVNTVNLHPQEELVRVQKLKHYFIPAFVYWGWESTHRVQLDPTVLAKQFASDFIYFADSLNLQNKLNGRELEVTVHSLPHSFVYTRKGYTVFLLVAYTTGGLEAIYPEPLDLRITYQEIGDSTAARTGTIVIPNMSKPMSNIWKSGRKFTGLYLEHFERTNRAYARKAMLQLAKEVEE